MYAARPHDHLPPSTTTAHTSPPSRPTPRPRARQQQRAAHEQPVIFWSLAIGSVGPVAVVAVPTIRKNYFGWTPPQPVPTTYPREQDVRRDVDDDVKLTLFLRLVAVRYDSPEEGEGRGHRVR